MIGILFQESNSSALHLSTAAACLSGRSGVMWITVFCTFVMQVLLPMMIYTAGPISGAHFNPMVTSVFVMAKMQVSCLFVHCVILYATSAGFSWLLFGWLRY